MTLGLRPDPDGMAKKRKTTNHRCYRQWRELEEARADPCLPNVGALVRRKLIEGIAQRRTDDADAYLAQYRLHAAMLARPGLVRERCVAQAMNTVPKRCYAR